MHRVSEMIEAVIDELGMSAIQRMFGLHLTVSHHRPS
jgi:small neutral amino acid transporter SnatA (MarC family)